MARYEDNHFDTLLMGLMQTKDKTQQQNQLKYIIMTTDTIIIGTLIVVFLGLLVTLIKIQL